MAKTMFIKVFCAFICMFVAILGISAGGAVLIGCYAPAPLKWISVVWFVVSISAEVAGGIALLGRVMDIQFDRKRRWDPSHKTSSQLLERTVLNTVAEWFA